MGRMVRIFEGRFGRLLLTDLAPRDELHAQDDPTIVLQPGEGEILFLNPRETHLNLDSKRALVFHAAGEWLRHGFPAVFSAEDGDRKSVV